MTVNRGIALFTLHQDGYYLPANSNANAACSILSSMRLCDKDMVAVRSHGYIPRLTNGEEIGRVDVRA